MDRIRKKCYYTVQMWVTFYYHWHKLIKTDFLYVSFNLKIDKLVPYRKLNNTFLYIHSKSNQLSSITKQLSSMTNRGILSLACNEDEFNKAINPFLNQLWKTVSLIMKSNHLLKMQNETETGNLYGWIRFIV